VPLRKNDPRQAARCYLGDCLAVFPTLPAGSVDAVVCDPPYGLEFMGKEWDAPWRKGAGLGGHDAGFSQVGLSDGRKRLPRPSSLGGTNPTCRSCGGCRHGREGKKGQQPCRCGNPSFDNIHAPRALAYEDWCRTWAKAVLRVTKPGGYLLAFGGTRTWHRLACAIEDAGWEIRDTLMWLHGQGMPKSKATLKPAFEPVLLARKPGPRVLPLNIEESRVRVDGAQPLRLPRPNGTSGNSLSGSLDASLNGSVAVGTTSSGRWPPNVVLGCDCLKGDGHVPDCPVALLDAQSGTLHTHAGTYRNDSRNHGYGGLPTRRTGTVTSQGNSGGASRFFYCAKASKADRGAGLENYHPMKLRADLTPEQRGYVLEELRKAGVPL
jgi:hypothetical protein